MTARTSPLIFRRWWPFNTIDLPIALIILRYYLVKVYGMKMDEKKHTIVEKNFDDRLKYAKSKTKHSENNKNNEKELSGKQLGFRIGTELIAAVIVGGLIGFGLDSWLGTKPWLLVVFVLLGNLAGLWNVFRITSGEGYKMGFKGKNLN